MLNLLLTLGLGVASLGVFVALYGLDKAKRRGHEEEGVAKIVVPKSLVIKSSGARGAREILGGALQPLGERLYDRQPGVGKTASRKPSLQQKLLRSGLRLRSGEFLALQLGCVGVALILGTLRFGFGWQCIVMAILAYFAPGVYVGQRMNKRQSQFSSQLPEVLMQLANALRAGLSLGAGMAQVAISGRAPISEEFARVTKEVSLGGAPEEVLAKMVRRVGNADLELVVIAIGIHRRVGGNLAEVLESIAETIRERVRIKGEVKTLTTQARTSGYVITGLPVLLALGLYVFMPAYFIPMTQNIIGIGALALGAILLGIGQAIMRKIVKIEV